MGRAGMGRMVWLAVALRCGLGAGQAPHPHVRFNVNAIDQNTLWTGVKAEGPPDKLPEAALSPEQTDALAQELRKEMIWSCTPEELDATWFGKLQVARIPVSPVPVFLIEAGPGCARDAEGRRAAMWMVRFEQGRMFMMAANYDGFVGKFYSMGSAGADGWRDVVLVNYADPSDSALNYFRFNGQSYEEVSRADLRTDAGGRRTITDI